MKIIYISQYKITTKRTSWSANRLTHCIIHISFTPRLSLYKNYLWIIHALKTPHYDLCIIFLIINNLKTLISHKSYSNHPTHYKLDKLDHQKSPSWIVHAHEISGLNLIQTPRHPSWAPLSKGGKAGDLLRHMPVKKRER